MSAIHRLPVLLLAWLLLLGVLLGAAPPPALGHRGMVAADQELASRAGAEILAAGGNAVDAAVATALACGVVQPSSSGLGGGGFAVMTMPDGEGHVLDFREVAPAAATRAMFVEAGAQASRQGGLAVAVPGEGPGLAMLHARWGRLPLARVARPAVRLARDGYDAGWYLAGALTRHPDGARLARELFGRAPIRQGDAVRRAALARTLQNFADTAGRDLTSGRAAADLVTAVGAAGGLITAHDLANYQPRERPPLVGSYRGWKVTTMPPPSSGGVVLLQVLGVLEGYEPGRLGHAGAELIHLEAEAFKHAFADRARYMGDPDRVDVPVQRLLSPERLVAIRRAIVPGRTFPSEYYGTPVDPGTDAGTQHISVLDADGMAVALTTTVNTSFGSGVVAPGSGIVLNDEMDDFVARPGEPNAYGLVGSEANAVAPGARPLSSMTPTVLISPDGTRRIVVGASGGPTIISAVVQVIVDIVDFGMDPSAAVGAPRVHHQWMPDELVLDDGLSEDTERALIARGHVVRRSPALSSVQVILGAPGEMTGASDPRKGGWPAGVR